MKKVFNNKGKTRLMFQDEAGFGRINKPKYCWCKRGKRPNVPCHHIREYRYAYRAVEPLTGDSCFLILPHCNTVCMNVFLEELSKQYPEDMILLCCDGAAWHKSKTLQGRKRHIVVDVLGCLLSVDVHAANIHDTKSGISTAKQSCERYPSIQKFCADAGYRGTFVPDGKEQLGLEVDISEKIKPHQWEKLPWRWVLERTLSWLNHSRRLSKDYEISISSAEAMLVISHLHTLLKRL